MLSKYNLALADRKKKIYNKRVEQIRPRITEGIR